MPKRNGFTAPSFAPMLVVAAFSFILGWQATVAGILSDSKAVSGEHKVIEGKQDLELDLFWTVWGYVKTAYIDADEIENKAIVYGAIKGMVEALGDHYTVFMDPQESQQFSDTLDGRLEGIGAELTVEDRNLIVVSPLRESPAEKAGLQPNDIIFMIDGEMASDMTLIQAVSKIRGERGTSVTLTIIREGFNAPFDVRIVRDSISVASVTMEKLDKDIAYISVNQFNDKTDEDFSKAISELVLSEPKGLIVDLRYNGGGYLDIAVELLSYLLPSDMKAVTLKTRGQEDEVQYTNGNQKLLNVPLVVIVNESSASASEIVAGAIQDHKRGVILGTQSFGKGTVQEVESFFDGSSMRITIAKWYTPNDHNINKVGITPDIVVDITEDDLQNERDPQKDAAVRYLENLQ